MRSSSRLHAEWQRLYAADPAAVPTTAAGAPNTLIDAQGRTRTLVMALARPAEWAPLSAVWQAVQTEAGLPAPGIAVSGTDSFQLWFSLAEAVPVADAHAFLEALCQRCLGQVSAARLSLLPTPDAAAAPSDAHHGAQPPAHHAAAIPARQGEAEQWSAFVAPDLAPMFNEAPWLDLPPSPEGQAELLSRLRSVQPAEWQAAQAWLRGANGADTAGHQATHPASMSMPEPGASAASAGTALDPRTFLREVMNDATVPLALRIEAAKALLPHVPHTPPAA